MTDKEKRDDIGLVDYIIAGFVCLLGLCGTVIALFYDKSGWGLFVGLPLGVSTLYAIYCFIYSLLED